MSLFAKEIEAELVQMFENVADKMGKQISEKCLATLQSQYQQVWQTFEERVQNLLRSLDQAANQNSEVNSTILQQKQTFHEEWKKLQELLVTSVQGAIQKFEENLVGQLDSKLVEKITQSMQDHLQKISTSMQESLTQLQSQLGNTNQQTQDSLAVLVNHGKVAIANMVQESKENGERLEANYEQRLGNFFVALKQHITNWNTSLESAHKQILDKHADVIARITQNTEQFHSSGDQIIQQVQKMQTEDQQAYQTITQKHGIELKVFVEQSLQQQRQELEKKIASANGKIAFVVILNILTLLATIAGIALPLLK